MKKFSVRIPSRVGLTVKKQITILKNQNTTNRESQLLMAGVKNYDLEKRTLAYAKEVRSWIRDVPKDICNIDDCKQLVRSSGSVGANYIEANESLSKKDFIMRIKISRKESKESRFWLKLIDTQEDEKLETKKNELIQESTELLKFFSAILNNS